MAIRTDGGATGRAFALGTLLVLAAVALRGYLPGASRGPRAAQPDSPFALAAVIVLLLGAVGIVTMAVVMRTRHRAAARAGTASTPDWLRGDVGRPSWRALLITFVVVLAWLAIAMLLSRLGGGAADAPGYVPGRTPTSTPSPADVNPVPSTPVAAPHDSNLLAWFYAGTVIFLLVLVAGTVVSSRRSRRSVAASQLPDGPAGAAQTAVVSESLVRAAEVGLAEVEDLSREPRKAIIACYAAMERELALVPGAAPEDFDTASEVLARAVDRHALGPDNATQLVELFDEARFSPHVMNEGHREMAVDVLQRVLSELPSRT